MKSSIFFALGLALLTVLFTTVTAKSDLEKAWDKCYEEHRQDHDYGAKILTLVRERDNVGMDERQRDPDWLYKIGLRVFGCKMD